MSDSLLPHKGSTPDFPVLLYLPVCSVMSIGSMMPSNHPILYCPLFTSCSQSFPASRSFPVSWLFISGTDTFSYQGFLYQVFLYQVLELQLQHQSNIPMNILGWFPLGLTGLISMLSKGLFKSIFQHHNSKASILWHLAFFMVQHSHLYMTTGKIIAKPY